MGPEILVDKDIEAGAKLVTELDRAHFEIDCAFWWFSGDSRVYQLILATPLAARLEPTAVYQRLQTTLRKSGVPLSLDRIKILKPGDPLVRAMQRAFKMGPATGRLRVSSSFVNGIMVEDALVYRV